MMAYETACPAVSNALKRPPVLELEATSVEKVPRIQ